MINIVRTTRSKFADIFSSLSFVTAALFLSLRIYPFPTFYFLLFFTVPHFAVYFTYSERIKSILWDHFAACFLCDPRHVRSCFSSFLLSVILFLCFSTSSSLSVFPASLLFLCFPFALSSHWHTFRYRTENDDKARACCLPCCKDYANSVNPTL